MQLRTHEDDDGQKVVKNTGSSQSSDSSQSSGGDDSSDSVFDSSSDSSRESGDKKGAGSDSDENSDDSDSSNESRGKQGVQVRQLTKEELKKGRQLTVNREDVENSSRSDQDNISGQTCTNQESFSSNSIEEDDEEKLRDQDFKEEQARIKQKFAQKKRLKEEAKSQDWKYEHIRVTRQELAKINA